MIDPTVRISLPGFDAGTDTNLDHFALNADQDNVLIKEFQRGSGTIGNGTITVVHNLGYIPLFFVYVNSAFILSTGWSLVPAYQNNGISVPKFTATSDTGTLTIINNTATSQIFNYYVFYDNFTGGTQSFTQSDQAFKVSKSGIDAGTAKDPNSFIFHSDLNTFKIIKEGTTSITTSGTSGTYSFAHSAGLGTPTSYAVFMTFPDGKTAYLPGEGDVYSYDSNWQVFFTEIDGTNIAMHITGTGVATLPLKYYVFETPL